MLIINPLTSPGEGVTVFTSPYLSAGAPVLGEAKGLKELNLSNFNTNNVTDMKSMFSGCSSLKELNLNNFNTNNVTNMSDMFRGCFDELKLKIKSQFKNFKEIAFKNY